MALRVHERIDGFSRGGAGGESRDMFERWYREEFRRAAGVPASPESSDADLIRRLDPLISSGGVLRMSEFVTLRYRFPLNEINSCASIEMVFVDPRSTPEDQVRASIAVVYWRDKPEPAYVCVGPVLESRDGEFREFLVPAANLLADYGKTRFATKQSEVEARLLDLIGDGTLELNVREFGKLGKIRMSALEDSRLVLMSAVAYILDMFDIFVTSEIKRGADEASYHFGPKHDKLASAVRSAFAGLVDFAELNVLPRAEWAAPHRQFALGLTVGSSGRCGTKTIPLTEREVAAPHDVTLATWREFWALEMGGDLGINFIAPGFPQIVSSGLIRGAVPALYDNPAMHEKLGRGGAARLAVESIRRAREIAMTEAGARRKKDPRGALLFEDLDARAYHAVDYAASFLAPTEWALVVAQEFEGFTMYDLITSRIPALISHMGEGPVRDAFRYLAEPALLDKVIFDWAWTLHAGHVRGGIIQGDLHANNITARKFVGRAKLDPMADTGAICVYADSDAAYALPHSGGAGYILDFSRAILGGPALASLDAEHGDGRADVFRRDQSPRVYDALKKWAPTIVERDPERWRGLVLSDSEAVFAALSGADFAALGQTLVALATHAEKRAGEAGREPMVATERLRDRGETLARAGRLHMAHALSKILGHEDDRMLPAGRGAPAPLFAGTSALAAALGEWDTRTGWKTGALAKRRVGEVWQMDNPMKYSARRYDRFPPWARAEDFVAHLGELTLTDIISRGPLPPHAFSDHRPERDVVADQARSDLDPPPTAASDAWLRS